MIYDMDGDGMTTTGGCPRTPDWMASGRQMKCATGGGGAGDCVGGGIYSESLRIWFGKNKARRDVRRASFSYGLDATLTPYPQMVVSVIVAVTRFG